LKAFTLQSVQKVRLAERDERRADLADAQRSQLALQTDIEQLERDLQQLRAHARGFLMPGTIDVSHLQDCHSCELTLRQEIDRLDRQRHEAATKAEQCHAALIEADRQVRMLEKLSDKKREEHRRNEENREDWG